MIATIRYGSDASLRLSLPTERLIAVCGTPAAQSIADLAGAVRQSLDSPLDFPALSRAIVPGDRAVVAVDRDLPRAAAVVQGVVNYLVDHGLDPAAIGIVCSEPPGPGQQLVPDAFGRQMTVEVHDPDKRDGLSYLAVDQDGRRIYLNRRLCEADLVVPVGSLRCESGLEDYGPYGGVCPAFSDRKAQEEIRLACASGAPRDVQRNRERIREVAWLLGVHFAVRGVPGADGELLAILAGAPEAVFRQGQEIAHRAWRESVPRRASLVVAAIGGTAAEQTWFNVARAVSAAARVVAAGGAIAVCTDVADAPGAAFRQVANSRDARTALRRLRKHTDHEALAAAAVAQVAAEHSIYLLSRMPEGVVDELGMIPLADQAELDRLAAGHGSCILLANAQFAAATPADE